MPNKNIKFVVHLNALDKIMCGDDGVVASGYISVKNQPPILLYNEDYEAIIKLDCFKKMSDLMDLQVSDLQ